MFIVLAVAIAVIGAFRGWFILSGGNRIRPTSNGNAEPMARIPVARLDAETSALDDGSFLVQDTKSR